MKHECKRARITVRITEQARSALCAAARSAGMGLSEYLRALIEGRTLDVVVTNVDGGRLDRLTLELKRSGSNLNQIAHCLNRGDRVSAEELTDVLGTHRRVLSEVSSFIEETRPI